jgi:hypothetical protein
MSGGAGAEGQHGEGRVGESQPITFPL